MTREQMKSLFTIHTNGQDEWIRVDKRIYKKAIDKIYDAHEAELKAKDERIEAQSSVIIACQNAILQKDERITELKAKLESLRGYCRKLIEHFNSKDNRSDYDWGLRDRTITILDKLDDFGSTDRNEVEVLSKHFRQLSSNG